MKIKIDNSAKVPIYEQIKKQIKDSILDINTNEDIKLPSIRALSNEIDISLMTVKKAYDELLDEGFIVTIPGKGSYINKKSIGLVRKEKIKEIEKHLEEAITISKKINLTKEELLTYYLKLEKKKRNN